MGTVENRNEEESRAGEAQEPGNPGLSQGRVNPTYPRGGGESEGREDESCRTVGEASFSSVSGLFTKSRRVVCETQLEFLHPESQLYWHR